MTFYYKQKIEEVVIYLIEEGENTYREIAEICNISISTVKKIIDNYDKFYQKIFRKM